MKIAVIIVTYNGEQWIQKCIQTVLDSSIDVEIIIIDNKSTDNTLQIINNSFKDKIVLIENDVNLGFGAANNIGISEALKSKSDYFFLLNQDAYVKKDTIEILINHAKNNSNFGILSPVHLSVQKGKLDKDFEQFVSPPFCKSFLSDAFFKRLNTTSPYEVKFVNAAAWLITKECIENVGGFSPSFFHYGEDENYCQRSIFHGYNIGVVANTSIIHDRTEKENVYFDGIKNVVRHYLIKWSNPLVKNNKYSSYLFLLSFYFYYLLKREKRNVLVFKELIKERFNNFKNISKNLIVSKSNKKYKFLIYNE